MTFDIYSLESHWHSYVRCVLMLHYSKKVADGLCRAQWQSVIAAQNG